MYQTIIVPTDLMHQDITIESLKKAAQLSNNGRIILLNVLEEVPSYALIGVPDEFIKDIVPKTRDAMHTLVNMAEVKAEVEVRSGSAYRHIIEVADKHKADLILINSHQPSLQDYLLGSTAAKVVRHSHCSVLVER